jgi:hypothetical protein
LKWQVSIIFESRNQTDIDGYNKFSRNKFILDGRVLRRKEKLPIYYFGHPEGLHITKNHNIELMVENVFSMP